MNQPDQDRRRCRRAAPLLRRSALSLFVAGTFLAGVAAAPANQLTFQVNLGVQRALGNFNPANGDTVVVAGSFSPTDWTTTSVLTANPGETNVFTGTFSND